jgi:hypothetical protein
VTNNTASPVNVVAVYRTAPSFNQPEIRDEVSIAAGASHFFAQRTFDQGTATFTYAIASLNAGPAAAQAPFPGVQSPVKDYKWTLGGSAASPTITGSLLFYSTASSPKNQI